MKDPREPGYDPFNPGPEGNREIAELTEKEKKKVERFWKRALKKGEISVDDILNFL